MRIGLITPGFSADERDWCIPVMLHLVRQLAYDHEVTILTLRYPHRAGMYRVAGATVYALGGASVSGVRRGLLLSRALTHLLRLGRDRRFDVLHAFWADEPGFLAVTAGRFLNVPSLVSIMGGELVALPTLGYGGQLSRLNRMLSRVALRNATHVSVGSHYLEQLAQAWVPGRSLHRLTLGIEPDFFTPAGRRAELGPGPNLLAVGGLVPVKGQAFLIEVLARIVAMGIHARLHLVGSGPQHNELVALAERLGIAQRVVLHGPVPHNQLPEYYRAADICLLGSQYESQCMAVVEAAACGRVTVGSAVGLLPELGLPIPAGDPAAFATLVAGLLAVPERLHALGRQQRSQVEQHYTLGQTIQTLERIYASRSSIEASP